MIVHGIRRCDARSVIRAKEGRSNENDCPGLGSWLTGGAVPGAFRGMKGGGWTNQNERSD